MTTQTAVVVDVVAGGAAALATLSVFHEFQFHEAVGTVAGLMAIAYYLYQFSVWVWKHWDNSNGD